MTDNVGNVIIILEINWDSGTGPRAQDSRLVLFSQTFCMGSFLRLN